MKDEGKKFVLGLVSLPFAVIVHGFVLVKLWDMFISTTFNLSEITIIQAIGLSLVIDFIFLKIDWAAYADKVDFSTYLSKFIAYSFVTPFVVLGFGYIINLFM